MAKLINEKTSQLDGNIFITIQSFDDNSKIEIEKKNNLINSKKETKSDGSYIKYNKENKKIEELSPNGTITKFNPQTGIKIEQKTKDGEKTTFHDNGKISSIQTPNGKYTCFFENGNLSSIHENNYEIKLDINGNKLYELKDNELYINPDYFSYYKLGIKSPDTETHWQENTSLDPNKKTLLCLGGDQTKDARAANGNTNAFASVLGLTPEQLKEIQLCSCYRPGNNTIFYLLRKTNSFEKQINIDYQREVLKKFMPYMAQIKNNKFERYSGEKLAQNFRNIIIQAHCAGANDLPKIAKIFNETLIHLGYNKKEISHAMKQTICITNNSQREFTDDLGFTLIHRYSVKDGQFEPEYNENYSDGYPVLVKDHENFKNKTGNKASFVKIKSNEMLMIFDKILETGNEHNAGFWTTYEKHLTEIGKQQAQLMKQIGQFWYHNQNDISDVENLIKTSSQGTETENFVDKAIKDGKKLKAEHKNPLKNHHILKSAWNKFKSNKIAPEKNGIYKLLSEKER